MLCIIWNPEGADFKSSSAEDSNGTFEISIKLLALWKSLEEIRMAL